MKMLKSLLFCSLVAGFAAAASAQTEIYICGSTAYRGGVTKAVQDILATSGTFQEAWDGGSGAKGVYGGGAGLFIGSVPGISGTTYIHTYWTGSLAGCVDVASGNTITKWIPDNATTAAVIFPTATGNPYTGGTNIYTQYTAISAVPNVAFSDSFNTSVAKSISGISKTIATAVNTKLTQASGTGSEIVTGVLPFIWVAGTTGTSGTTAAPFTNMTQEAASQLIQQGYVSVSCLASGTGSSSLTGDTADYAFLIGRNEDSGTRICAQAEAQVGSAFGAQSFGRPMLQYYALFTGTTYTTDGAFVSGTLGDGDNNGTLQGQSIETGGVGAVVSDIGLWPAVAPLNTEPTIDWDIYGHSGQIGGGDVAAVLEAGNPLTLNITAVDAADGNTTSSAPDNWNAGTSKAYLIGYLGSADAGGIPAASNCLYLTYNGVNYSAVTIQNGSYDFWSFEHTYYNNSTASAATKSFAGTLVDKVYFLDCQTDSSGNTDSKVVPTNAKVGGLIFANVSYSKTQEGAVISPLF
jgi:hypothetical protein